MKNKSLRFLSIIFLLLGWVFTSCSSAGDSATLEPTNIVSSAAPEEIVEAPAPEPTEVVEEVKSEPQESIPVDLYAGVDPTGRTITFWHSFSGKDETALLKIIDEFNSSNEWDITVIPEPQGSDTELQTNMGAAIQTADMPALVLIKEDQAMSYQFEDALSDIDALLNHETWGLTSSEIDDYYPALLNQAVSPFFNHERLSFPIYAWMDVLFYNMDWMTELEYDAPPTNPGSFIEMACSAALHPFSKSKQTDRIGYELNADETRFADWSLTFGGTAYSAGAEQYNFSSTPIVEAMTYLQKFITRGCARPVENPDEDQVNFGLGVSLFAIASTNYIPEIRANIEAGANFNWRVAPLPYSTQEPVINAELASISIPKTTVEDQLAGWLFLKYFTSPEMQAYWAQTTDYLAVRPSAAKYISGTPAFMMSLDLLKYGVTEPLVPGYSLVDDIRKSAIESIAAGNDVDATLSKLTSDANSILAEQLVHVPEIPDPWVDIDPSGATVIFWHNHLDTRQNTIQEIVQAFNDTNEWGITVEAQNRGTYSDIFYQLIPLFGTPDVPNLIVSYPFYAAVYHQSDGLVDLNSLVESPEWGLTADEVDDFFPNIFNQDIFSTFGNIRLGFPVQRSIDLLYYNADWLTALGYDGPPATPEEFAAMACNAVANPFEAGISEAGIGYQVYANASQLADWIFGFGGDYFNEKDGLYEFNQQSIIDTMTFLQKMITDECATVAIDRNETWAAFADGNALFMVESSGQLTNMDVLIAAGAGFDWGVVAIPHTTATPSQNAFGASLNILKSTPEKELASWLFIQYLTSPENQAKWSNVSRFLPVRASPADFFADEFENTPEYQTAFDLMEFSVTEPSVPGYDFVRQEMEISLTAVLEGADILEVLDYLDNAANQILASHLLP